jgi:hypothetical protein
MTRSDFKNTSALVHKTTMSDVDAGLNFVLSDETPDAYNDVIRANGWRFPKSIIGLFNHSKEIIIGRFDNIRIEGTKLGWPIDPAHPVYQTNAAKREREEGR